MKIINKLEKIKQLDQLIRMRNTGQLNSLSQKMGMSARQVSRYIEEMKDMGATIIFNKHLQTYEYETPVKFDYGFSEVDLKKIYGGFSFDRQKMSMVADIFVVMNNENCCHPG